VHAPLPGARPTPVHSGAEGDATRVLAGQAVNLSRAAAPAPRRRGGTRRTCHDSPSVGRPCAHPCCCTPVTAARIRAASTSVTGRGSGTDAGWNGTSRAAGRLRGPPAAVNGWRRGAPDGPCRWGRRHSRRSPRALLGGDLLEEPGVAVPRVVDSTSIRPKRSTAVSTAVGTGYVGTGGAPGRIRTCDTRFRKPFQVLGRPAPLRAISALTCKDALASECCGRPCTKILLTFC
jgi:hypothetical protein